MFYADVRGRRILRPVAKGNSKRATADDIVRPLKIRAVACFRPVFG
jgi:hypothetical protein